MPVIDLEASTSVDPQSSELTDRASTATEDRQASLGASTPVQLCKQALVVYSRRRTRSVATSRTPANHAGSTHSSTKEADEKTGGVAVALATPPQVEVVVPGTTEGQSAPRDDRQEGSPTAVATDRAASSLESREAFINRVKQHTTSLLPVPIDAKRRSRVLTPGTTPRRSRRLAGAGIEFQAVDWKGRSQKKAMKTLQIIGENDGIDQQAQDE